MSKKIIYITLFYAVFTSAALFAVVMVDNYTVKRSVYLDRIVANAHAKMDIISHVKFHIGNLKYYAYGYAVSDSFSETDQYERSIALTLAKLRQNLDVLSSGGTLEESMSAAASDSYVKHYEIKYEKLYDEGYDLNSIEMRALLAELNALTDDFRNLLANKIIAEQSENLAALKNFKRKLNVNEKELQTFFNVFSVSADKYYISASNDIAVLEKYRSDQRKKLEAVKNLVSVLFTALFVACGILLYISVVRMFRENSGYRHRMKSLTDDFNSSLAVRTRELSAELSERIAELNVFKSKYKELKTIFESLSHPFYVIDANTYEIVYANKAAYAIGGMSGGTCYELTHHQAFPCSGLEHPCPLQMVKNTGKEVTVEHIHLLPDGTEGFFEVRGYPVYDSSGKLIQMIEFSLDITDWKRSQKNLMHRQSMLEEKITDYSRLVKEESNMRMRAQEVILQNEGRMECLIRNVSEIIAVIKRNGRIVYLSPSAERKLGYSAMYAEGKIFSDFVHSEDRSYVEYWLEDAAQSREEINTAEFRLIRSGGDPITAEASIVNMLNDDILDGLVLYIRDITLRKAAEKEIRKMVSVLEYIPAGIFITDADSNVEYANPAFESFTGYQMSEVMGRKTFFMDSFDISVSAQKSGSKPAALKKKNGVTADKEVLIIPVHSDRGQVMSYVCMFDIQKNVSGDGLLSSQKLRSRFLSIFSHEVMTPLNSVMGFTDLLTETDLTEKQKKYAETVRKSANEIKKLFETVSDMAALESGSMSVSISRFRLKPEIDSLADFYSVIAREKGISFSYQYDSSIPEYINGDSIKIVRILEGLLSNAVKFTPDGGSASLKTESVDGRFVRFEVSDTGIGISESYMDKIFESFSQEDYSVTRSFDGAGIGLAYVKKLVNAMNSDIYVESRRGEGSVFRFTLDAGAETSCKKKKAETVCGRALLADSSDEVRDMLRSIGLTVDSAEDGEKAVEKFQHEKYDIVFLNKSLPVKDGISASLSIRQYENSTMRPPVPVILLAPKSYKGKESLLKDAGIDGFLSHPYSKEKFLNICESYMPEQDMSGIIFDFTLDKVCAEIGLDKKILKPMLHEFVEQSVRSVNQAEKALRDDDIKQNKDILQSVRSTAGNFGFSSVCQLLKNMEESGRKKDISEYRNYHAQVLLFLNHVFEELNRS